MSKVTINKAENASNGALYCKIFEAVHPGKIAMHKVNWNAKYEYDSIANYKLLQQAFNKCEIAKNIDVDHLCKARGQENFEFLQWIKHYYEKNYKNHKDVKPEERDNTIKKVISKSLSKENFVGSKKNIGMGLKSKSSSHLEVSDETSQNFKEECDRLSQRNEDLEKERDFYHSKLKDIEYLIKEDTDQTKDKLKELLESILFATKEVEVFSTNGKLNVDEVEVNEEEN